MGAGGGEGLNLEAATATSIMRVFPDDTSLRTKLCPFSGSNSFNANTGTISGGAWDRVVQCIATHHKGVLLPPFTMTMTCYIPSASVGAVIGRRGQTVASLQKNAAAAASTNQPVRVSVVAATKELQQHDSKHTQQPPLLHSHPPHTPSALTGAGALLGGQVNTGLAPSLTLPNVKTATQTAATPKPAPVLHAAYSTATVLPSTEYHTYTPLDWSDPAWTPVVIRADAPAVCHAAQGMVELIVKSSSSSGGSGGGSYGSPSSIPPHHHLLLDQVILDVPIATSKHATLLGDGGATLATLSAEADVRIMVPPQSQQPSQRLDLIQLEGDLPNVLSCLANIFLLLVSPSGLNDNANASPSSTTSNNASTNTNTSTNASISTTVVLSVLPSQTKLRNIARKTDCQVRKQRRSNTLVVVGATNEQVQAAVALLQKWQTAQQPQQPNDEGSTEGGGETMSTTTTTIPATQNTPPRNTRRQRGGRSANKQRNNNNNSRGNNNQNNS